MEIDEYSYALLHKGDGYIELVFTKESCTLEIDEVRDGWMKAKQLSPEKKLNILLITGKWSLLDKESRAFVVSEFKTWPHVAIVVDNMGQRLMGKVILNITGRGNHTKLFEKKEVAIEWLISKKQQVITKK